MSVSWEALANDHILGIAPYEPGKPIEELERELGISDVIKLASNENPLPPSDRVMKAMQTAPPTSTATRTAAATISARPSPGSRGSRATTSSSATAPTTSSS